MDLLRLYPGTNLDSLQLREELLDRFPLVSAVLNYILRWQCMIGYWPDGMKKSLNKVSVEFTWILWHWRNSIPVVENRFVFMRFWWLIWKSIFDILCLCILKNKQGQSSLLRKPTALFDVGNKMLYKCANSIFQAKFLNVVASLFGVFILVFSKTRCSMYCLWDSVCIYYHTWLRVVLWY